MSSTPKYQSRDGEAESEHVLDLGHIDIATPRPRILNLEIVGPRISGGTPTTYMGKNQSRSQSPRTEGFKGSEDSQNERFQPEERTVKTRYGSYYISPGNHFDFFENGDLLINDRSISPTSSMLVDTDVNDEAIVPVASETELGNFDEEQTGDLLNGIGSNIGAAADEFWIADETYHSDYHSRSEDNFCADERPNYHQEPQGDTEADNQRDSQRNVLLEESDYLSECDEQFNPMVEHNEFGNLDQRILHPKEWHAQLNEMEQTIISKSILKDAMQRSEDVPVTTLYHEGDLSESLSSELNLSEQALDTNLSLLSHGDCINIFQDAIECLKILRDQQYSTNGFTALISQTDRQDVAALVYITENELQSVKQSVEKMDLQPLLTFMQSVGFNACVESLDRLNEKFELKVLAASTLLAKFVSTALATYSGAHLERFDIKYFSRSVNEMRLTDWLILRRRTLRCLQDFLHGQSVWVFEQVCTQTGTRRITPLYLLTFPEVLADTWGPLWSVTEVKSENEITTRRSTETYENSEPRTSPRFQSLSRKRLSSVGSTEYSNKQQKRRQTERRRENVGSSVVFGSKECQGTSSPLRIKRYNLGIGCIVPADKSVVDLNSNAFGPYDGEVLAHWTSDQNWIKERQNESFPESTAPFKLLIGAGSIFKHNHECPITPDGFTESFLRHHSLRTIGTILPEYTTKTEVIAMINPPYFQFGVAWKFKKRNGSTLKEALLAAWLNEPEKRNPSILRYRLGVEISACTRNARRVPLSYLLASSSIRNYLKGIQFEWPSDECRNAYFEALQNRDPKSFESLYTLNKEWRQTFGKAVGLSFDVLIKTGTAKWKAFNVLFKVLIGIGTLNDNLFDAIWIPEERHVYLATFSGRQQSWAGLLVDNMYTCTVGLVTSKCLEFRSSRWPSVCRWRSHHKANLGQEYPQSVLETSIVVNTQSKLPDGLIFPAKNDKWQLQKIKPGVVLDLGCSGQLKYISCLHKNSRAVVKWQSSSKWKDAVQWARENVLEMDKAYVHWEWIQDENAFTLPVYLLSEDKVQSSDSSPIKQNTADHKRQSGQNIEAKLSSLENKDRRNVRLISRHLFTSSPDNKPGEINNVMASTYNENDSESQRYSPRAAAQRTESQIPHKDRNIMADRKNISAVI
jgi:hypothetical protein